MKSTRAALTSTHAVSPGSMCMPADYAGAHRRLLQGVRPPFPRANPHQVLDGRQPDLPVTDLAGGCGLDDDVDDVLCVVVRDDDLQPHLRDEVHGVLRTAVDLGVAALPAVAAHLGDRQSLDAEGLECLLHIVELERLDDRSDEFHALAPSGTSMLEAAVR